MIERAHDTRKRGMVLTILSTLVVVLLSSGAEGATFVVRAEGKTWEPKMRRVVRNDRVRWRNPTNKTHDITSRGKNWDFSVYLSPGESVRRRFGSVGRFRYRCTLHSAIVDGRCEGMCGTIVVRKPDS